MPPHTVAIPLTQGKVAVVDANDAPALLAYRWQAAKSKRTYYARRAVTVPPGRQRYISMHRQIMGDPPGKEVDHENGDGLDNRRANLRVCTQAQNSRNKRLHANNTSGFRGVRRSKDTGVWIASIAGTYLGSYDTAEEAARAYDTRAREMFGAFAKLNFPDDVAGVRPRIGAAPRTNTSGYRGVSAVKGSDRWTARLTHRGQRTYLGTYDTAEQAARALEDATGRLERV